MATTIRICDIVTVKSAPGDRLWREWNDKPTRWRVKSYLKAAVKPEFADLASGMLEEIVFEACQKVGPDAKRLVWCSQDEAEYLSLSGMCGGIARVADCEVVGRVPWSDEHVREAENHARNLIGEMIF